jgi:YhcH/YjgK/YiaL family protein
MILDRLDRLAAYAGLNPHFAAALEFLARPDLAGLAPGKYPVTDAITAIVADAPGRGRHGARLEVHRHTIDIQYCVQGNDELGWRVADELRHSATDYDPTSDTEKFFDEPTCWVPLPQGCGAIVFPDDAHAPLAAEGPLLKVILKIPHVA